MRAYLLLIFSVVGSQLYAMDSASPSPLPEDLFLCQASFTQILMGRDTMLSERCAAKSQDERTLVQEEDAEEQRGTNVVIDELSIAKDLLEYDHTQKKVPRSIFMEQLAKYAQQYPGSPVWSAAQARLGDMHREMAKETLLSEKFKLEEQAKRYYLSAYQHEVALPETKSWAAVQLGYMCIYGCKYSEAKKYFEAGVKDTKPNFLPSLYNGLGVAYYCLANQKMASRCWNLVIKSDNKLEKGRAYHNLAILSAGLGKYTQAIQCLSVSRSLGHQYSEQEFEQLVSSWKSASLNSPVSL